MTRQKKKRLEEALAVLRDLGLPRQQLNERTGLCLLALLNLSAEKSWAQAEAPLLGITPIMEWARAHFGTNYAPNTRETFRRQSMHQFVQAGLALYNPDDPLRAVNSPRVVYQIEPQLLALLRTRGSAQYPVDLTAYLGQRPTLIERYARARVMNQVPVRVKPGLEIRLSTGEHSTLIKQIVEDFGSRFAAAGELLYVGDTGDKAGFLDTVLLASLGVVIDGHGKMPDVVIYLPDRNWLLLIEAVTSHGPVDGKRHQELSVLFKQSRAGLVYVSAFPTRKVFLKYLESVAWETEVWIADAPSHMIHFNGDRFLGPQSSN